MSISKNKHGVYTFSGDDAKALADFLMGNSSSQVTASSPISPRDIFLEKLQHEFPKCWLKPGEEFAPEYAGSIWTGEGSEVRYRGEHWEAFDLELWNSTGGVIPPLAEFLNLHQWRVEWYDAGTVLLYPPINYK